MRKQITALLLVGMIALGAFALPSLFDSETDVILAGPVVGQGGGGG